MKRSLILAFILMICGCGKTNESMEIVEQNEQTLSVSERASDKEDDENSSDVSTNELTAILDGAVPDEYKGKTELYFQSAGASSELVQENTGIYNGAVCAVDGDVITSWQEGAPGNGVGETLTLGFSGTQIVNYLEFNAGNWRDETQWERNLRPKTLEITVNGKTVSVEMQDVRASQFVVFSEPVETASFTIKIVDVYSGAEGESDVPISEIRAYGDVVSKNERTIKDTQPGPEEAAVQEDENQNVSSDTVVEEHADSGSYGFNQYGNPDWFETRPYWKSEEGAYVCKVSGSTGDDLSFDFNDGVSLSGTYCSYEIQSDGSIVYSYKKGWSVSYDPSTDRICSICDPGYTQSRNQGYYYPISGERYESYLSDGGTTARADLYEGTTFEMQSNAQKAALLILEKLDDSGTHSFISDSGKSAITFEGERAGGDVAELYYTNISGVTPDDVWVLIDGSLSENSATIHVRNDQHQEAVLTADFSNGTIDFSGITYRNTETKYH